LIDYAINKVKENKMNNQDRKFPSKKDSTSGSHLNSLIWHKNLCWSSLLLKPTQSTWYLVPIQQYLLIHKICFIIQLVNSI